MHNSQPNTPLPVSRIPLLPPQALCTNCFIELDIGLDPLRSLAPLSPPLPAPPGLTSHRSPSPAPPSSLTSHYFLLSHSPLSITIAPINFSQLSTSTSARHVRSAHLPLRHSVSKMVRPTFSRTDTPTDTPRMHPPSTPYMNPYHTPA